MPPSVGSDAPRRGSFNPQIFECPPRGGALRQLWRVKPRSPFPCLVCFHGVSGEGKGLAGSGVSGMLGCPMGRPATKLFLASIVCSLVLFVLLGKAYLEVGSKLALAQAADSLSDVLTGAGLLWALKISAKPADEDHPFGHHGAEPIAALVVAVLVGVLAVEVLRDAVLGLSAPPLVDFSWPLLGALGMKVVIKSVFVVMARNRLREAWGSVLGAFKVDAQSDAVLGLVSIAGLVGTHVFVLPELEPYLAFPVALWIGLSGLQLGRENIRLLMGQAPGPVRQAELRALAGLVDGVRHVEALKARSYGSALHVWVEVWVDPQLSVGSGHDIGERVEAKLLACHDVGEVVVHVDAWRDPSASAKGP